MAASGTIDRQRAQAAERQRRYRVRRQTAVLLMVEMERFWFVEALIDAGRLGQWDEDNREAVERAVTRLLEDWQIGVTRDGVDPVASFTVRPGESDDHSRIRNEGEMKSFPASLNIRVPEGIDKAVARVAAQEGKTANEFMRSVVYEALRERGVDLAFSRGEGRAA